MTAISMYLWQAMKIQRRRQTQLRAVHEPHTQQPVGGVVIGVIVGEAEGDGAVAQLAQQLPVLPEEAYVGADRGR